MASICLLRTRVAPLGRRWASQSRLLLQLRRSPISTLPTITGCPAPTCACATTPDLEIDHIKPLHNTVPRHSTHVVVHTNRDDWASRIEDEKLPNIAKELKALLGPKGEFYEVSRLCHINRLPSPFAEKYPFQGHRRECDGHKLLFRSSRERDNFP